MVNEIAQFPHRYREGREELLGVLPDLPGCVATGATRDQADERMQKVIELHVKGLIEDGLPVPKDHHFIG